MDPTDAVSDKGIAKLGISGAEPGFNARGAGQGSGTEW